MSACNRPRIRVLSDGRPGHENQSVGLALALARRTGALYEVVKLDPAAGLWARMRAAVAAAAAYSRGAADRGVAGGAVGVGLAVGDEGAAVALSAGVADELGQESGGTRAGRPCHRESDSDTGGTPVPQGADPERDTFASRCDLVISAGHRTHLPLWWAARRLGAKSVVIMKPSLPLGLFDLALVPRHDLADTAKDTGRRILTRGALNRVPEVLPAKEERGLVLVGGPSKHHGWDGTELALMIARVVAAEPELVWTVADSRRTPEGFLRSLALPAGARAAKVPHQETGPGWLAGELARARVVWATADSVSMVHEAVTARAATGVLPVPTAASSRGGGRTTRAVAGLIADGYATSYAEWLRSGGGNLRAGPALHEAGRCAERIVAKWFTDTAPCGR